MKTIKSHILYEYLLLSIAAFLVLACAYTLSVRLVKNVLNHTLERKADISIEEEGNAVSFQYFVQENHLSMYDINSIQQWLSDRPGVIIRLYTDDTLLYDSIWDNASTSPEGLVDISPNRAEGIHAIRFSDGVARLIFLSQFKPVIYKWAKWILLLFYCLIYLGVTALFFRKKAEIMTHLVSDMRVLSAGDLNHAISVQGADELAALALAIDQFRLSILREKQTESSKEDANAALITELSHDLRTPLTSLIGYLEVSMDETLCPPAKIKAYNALSLRKAYRLRELTDKLFEFLLLTTRIDQHPLETVNANELIFQMVEEPLCDLEEKGVKVVREVSDISCGLRVNVDDIHRMFDNIFSNILKYADLSAPLVVRYHLEGGNLVLFFQNTVASGLTQEASTHVGLRSCETILAHINGKIEVQTPENTFQVTIVIPYESDET